MTDGFVSHSTGNFVQAASFGQADMFHGHLEPRKIKNVKPWSRNVAECDYHVCSVNRRGEVFDKFGDMLTYCGRCRSDDEAVSIWKGFIESSYGVHAENVVLLNG